MEIRVLKYFLAVAREENISKAAELLHLTQPTLSRQLTELERDLGKQLFVRGSRRIVLTNEGMLLRKRAAEIVELVERAESEISTVDDVLTGEIHIGGGETDAMRIISHVIRCFHKSNPFIKYHMYSGNAEDIMERLDRGLLDFGILIEPANTSKYDCIKLPTVDTWGLLMRKDSKLAEQESIHPKDLKKIPLLISRQCLIREEIAEWVGGDISELNIVAAYNLLYNAMLMVDEGIGYALCLDKLINTTGDSNLCFRPLEPRLTAGLVLVRKKYQLLPKAAELFLKCLQDRIKSEEWRLS